MCLLCYVFLVRAYHTVTKSLDFVNYMMPLVRDVLFIIIKYSRIIPNIFLRIPNRILNP